jgi:copper chaperone
MSTVTYSVPAISCMHCTHTIEMEVSELQGVKSVKADVDSKNVTISFEAPATEEQIKALMAEIAYPVAGLAL